jgi:hypothetical protein
LCKIFSGVEGKDGGKARRSIVEEVVVVCVARLS